MNGWTLGFANVSSVIEHIMGNFHPLEVVGGGSEPQFLMDDLMYSM